MLGLGLLLVAAGAPYRRPSPVSLIEIESAVAPLSSSYLYWKFSHAAPASSRTLLDTVLFQVAWSRCDGLRLVFITASGARFCVSLFGQLQLFCRFPVTAILFRVDACQVRRRLFDRFLSSP